MQENINISDKDGRSLIKIRDGRIIATRYPKMSSETKNLIISIYNDLTGNENKEIMDFLDYKNEDLEFCS